MVTNSAVLAALILMLAVFWIGGETTFLAPYKRLLFTQYGVHIGVFLLVVFVNLADCPSNTSKICAMRMATAALK